MGAAQIWQYEGIGRDRETLEKVLKTFREEGVQGIRSQAALEKYIEKLGDVALQTMHTIDGEATLQILADCFGVVYAAKKYCGWEMQKAREDAKREMKEIEEPYEAMRELAAGRGKQIEELQDEIAHYKADLYDFYAEKGRVPQYGE